MQNSKYRLICMSNKSRYQETLTDFSNLLEKARKFMNKGLFPDYKYKQFVIIRLDDKVILAQSKGFNGEI